MSSNWHEDILCLFGVDQAKLEQFVQNEGEISIHLLDTVKFHGPKWTILPGAYIRNKLDEMNGEFLSEGLELAKWTEQEHSHSEIGNPNILVRTHMLTSYFS